MIHQIQQHKKELLFIFKCILIMGILCFFLYQPMMQIFENPQLLRKQLQNYGLWGQIFLTCIMILQVIFVFLPGEIVEIMAGFIYDPIHGLMLCLIGCAIGSFLIFTFVKKWGQPFIEHFISREDMKQAHFLHNPQKRNTLCFLIFLIPGTPKDLLTYLISLTEMKRSTFLFITTIARIPSIITSTIGGHALGIEDYMFSIIVFTVTGIISLIGLFIYNKLNKKTLSYHL